MQRTERRNVTFEWSEDGVPGMVTFYLEPMAAGRTLVMVEHVGIDEANLLDYHLGWHDYLVALIQVADIPVIRQSIWIEAHASQVWPYFTTEQALKSWWNETTEADVCIGGKFHFRDHGTNLVGRITEIVPQVRFAFTFLEEGTEGERDPYVIVIELNPEGEGTRVTITQSGFERLPEEIRTRVFEAFQRGWSDSWEIDRLAKGFQPT